jgi:Zn-dependent protease
MVNPNNLRNPKAHMALIAAAGPVSNFVMSFLSLMVLVPAVRFFDVSPTVLSASTTFSSINIILGVFNLLPIPPLNGSKIIAGLLPYSIYNRLPPTGAFGMIVLLLLMLTGVTSRILIPLTGTISDTFLSVIMMLYGILF